MPRAAPSAAEVRAIIGRLGDRDAGSRVLGSVTLREHQRRAVARLEEMIARHGGGLLADEAGLGKTYVALAVARDAQSAVVIAPAALRDMWRTAIDATGVDATILSYERLSRGPIALEGHDLVILDEAHHARNPATRRYRHIASLVGAAHVLMLSATPVHNRRRDLESLLALFLGERTATMTDAELARHVCRRERDAVEVADRPPEAAAPVMISLPQDESLLEVLIALPPPLPPSDGGDGGALLIHSLVRQWASSDGALRGALERRSARAAALIDALSAGRHPTRAELRHWSFGDGAVQLAFPELMAMEAGANGTQLLRAVQAHASAVDDLRRSLRARPGLDIRRAAALREIRRAHAGEKIVAFTAYADTAVALYRELRCDGGVAALSGSGGLVAGGGLTRRETLERFAPAAQGTRPPRGAERIDLLITTDLLSEGMNLQDASVVVHLDLPWTPARLEQRVGRAARLGSVHRRVAVYAIAPPASAERLIAVERRLREKLAAARGVVGRSATVLPPLTGGNLDDLHGISPKEVIRQALARWSGTYDPSGEESANPACAAVRSPDDGLLAAVGTDDGIVLVAGHRGVVTTDEAVVAEVVAMAEGVDCAIDAARLAAARKAVDAWCAARQASVAAGAGASEPLRRRILARIADAARRAPAHRRQTVAALAAQARVVVSAPMGTGAEQELARLTGGVAGDEEMLRAVVQFGGARAHPGDHGAERRVIGMLLLRR